ncbi:RND family efflux transporter MFP subunit [Rhodoblastus acidophilus]|uniref:efflux RND transporter periplasmic adaptor subunit n=1 Tax=Rhodoblastus acidophilus TaxID=1074 RepID=UPI002224E8D2|nr:efflux RND transporter periplasmic adaptor subunit [Rhodoblastus acidophilus]MCW2318567.1 RND family efflux transporter MFP subunit [Rhodoblastus acidophilus]
MALLTFLITAGPSGAGAQAMETPSLQQGRFKTILVEESDVPVVYASPGSVVSDGRVDVSSRVVGFIQQLDVREGQKVSRGDLLVRIDPADIDEAIRQAEASVRASQEDLDDARLDVEKYSKLSSSGAASGETFRKSKVRVDIARAVLDRARAALAAAEAQKRYAVITSPVDGVIVSVARRSGEMATAGAALVTVESHEVLLFKAFVAESMLASINTKTAVPVRIDALKGREFTGRVRGLVPSGDTMTRRYEINLVLPDDPRLAPGMFGRAEFILGARKALLVPREALVHRGGLEGVLVWDGKFARFRWLRTGQEIGGRVEAVAGLSAGETIVVSAEDAIMKGGEEAR